ncbi:MAG: hypothetical protein JWQ00_1898, partial [Noviherbaspirillum sp.]|nr:hypothetical protein [Noviherbaspirillum sp.]
MFCVSFVIQFDLLFRQKRRQVWSKACSLRKSLVLNDERDCKAVYASSIPTPASLFQR